MTAEDCAQLLRHIREANGLSVAQAAEKLAMPDRSYRNLEMGIGWTGFIREIAVFETLGAELYVKAAAGQNRKSWRRGSCAP